MRRKGTSGHGLVALTAMQPSFAHSRARPICAHHGYGFETIGAHLGNQPGRRSRLILSVVHWYAHLSEVSTLSRFVVASSSLPVDLSHSDDVWIGDLKGVDRSASLADSTPLVE